MKIGLSGDTCTYIHRFMLISSDRECFLCVCQSSIYYHNKFIDGVSEIGWSLIGRSIKGNCYCSFFHPRLSRKFLLRRPHHRHSLDCDNNHVNIDRHLNEEGEITNYSPGLTKQRIRATAMLM